METSLTLYIDTNTQSNQLFDDGSKAVWDNGACIVLRDSVEAVPFPSLNNPVVIHDFQFTAKRMGAAPTITASFYYPTCLDKEWTYKVFAVFGGERYFIKQIPTSGIANTEGMYQHSIELVSERVLLDNVYFYDVVNSEVGADKPVSNSSKFSFFGDINEFAKRINESLKYRNLDYTVVVDNGITSAAYTVAFDNKVISEVLQEVYNTYNLPYYFDGKTIHIGYTNNAITETFRYGVDDALLSINKENANYKVVTAVSGSGSEDNIPYYYPNDYESKEEVEAHGGTWINPSSTLQPPIYRESLGKERFYQAKNYVYPIPGSSETYTFDNLYEEGRPKEHIIDFSNIKPTITGIKNALGYGIDTFLEFAYDTEDNDEVDEEGNYLHPYFFAKLRKFDGANGFNLFDHAIDEAQMSISMTSGSCGSCEFIIGVGEDTQKNLVQVDGAGNLVRDENGNVRCGRDGMPVEEPQDRQNDTMNYEVWIALKKDVNTFGVVMPNATNNYKPSVTDTFVILHIDLPKAYILAAEERLKDALIAYMADNNSEKFNFSIAFSRIYFAEHPEVLALLNENARVQIEYNGDYIELYVSSFSYTMSNDTPLPEIKVELADTLTISQNALQTAINDLKGSGFGGIGVGASGDILKLGLAYFLRKDMNDRTRGKLSSDVGFEVGRYVSGASGATMFLDKQTGKTTAEMDKLYVRVKAYFETLEIVNVNSVGGKQIISPAGSMKCVKVENDSTKSYYRCYVLSEQDGEKIENRFHVGDQVYSQMFNAKPGVSNKVSNHYWWRLCVGVGEDYIDLSKTDCDSDSDAPAIGDIMCQRGNRNDVDRQNFIEISSVDAYSPNITLFQGVNSYSLIDKEIISYGVDKTTNQAFMNIYGNMYVGDRDNNSYLRYSIADGLQLKGTLDVGTKFGDKTLQEMLDKYAYLGRAFKENTKIVGGVIQTSSTVLGYTDDSGEYVVMSGTNGLVGDKGLQSIAFWAGGDMIDIFDYYDSSTGKFNVPAGIRPATALDRMDGTGYRANGALWWENDGNVHANPLSFFVGKNTVGALFAAFQIYPNNSSNPLYIIPHAPFTQFMLSTPASAGVDDYIFTPTDEALKLTRKKSTNANFWASGDIVAYAAGGGDITLPIASANALGAVKIGDGLSIAADGTLSATNTGSIAGIESSGAGNVVTSLDVISGGKVLLYTKGLTAWHAGNDGAGSGLDADMLDGKHSTEFLYYGGDNRDLGENSPFDTVTAWATKENIGNGAKLLYNSNGLECSILYSFKPSSYRYGTILKWGYSDTYLRIARYETTWLSSDWEKISAGYSDTAGNADLLDGIHASRLFTNLSNSGNNLSVTIGGTNKTLTVGYASNAGNSDTLDGYHGILKGEADGYFLNRVFGIVNQEKVYYLIGTLPLPSAIGPGASYVDFEVTGLSDFGSNSGQTMIVHASTRGSAKVEYITLGGAVHGIAAYKTTSSNVEIWIYCNANYSGHTSVRILRSYAFTGSMTYTTTDPGSLVEGVYMPIPKVGSITSTGDIIAYSTGTSNAPFKYWRPSISKGVLSWINDTSTTTPSPVTIVGQGVDYDWDGTSLRLRKIYANGNYSEGDSYVNLKGTSVGSVKAISTSSASGGSSTYGVYDTSGSKLGQFVVYNGAAGSSKASSLASTVYADACVITHNSRTSGTGIYLPGGNSIEGWRDGGYGPLYLNYYNTYDVCVHTSTVVTSDIRLKNIHGYISNVLDKLEKLSPFYYSLKRDQENKIRIGLSAQEVQNVVPECVMLMDDGYLSLDYSGLHTMFAIQGLKELYSLVKTQQARIEELEKRLQAIES